MKIDPVQNAFAQESITRLRKLVNEELIKLPPRPSRLQLVDHAELCAIVWLFDQAAEMSKGFSKIFVDYAQGMDDIKKIVEEKGTRAQIIERLDKIKKDVGL